MSDASNVLPALAALLRKHFGARAPGKAAAVLLDLNDQMLVLATPKALGWHALTALQARHVESILPAALEVRLALCGALADNHDEIQAAALAEAEHRATHRNPATRELRT